MTVLGLHDLTVSRGDRVLLSGVELAVSRGEAIYVTGANGAGKTTLLRMICGLAQPDHGEVRWGGEPIRRLQEEYARHLLFLGHAAALKDELSAVENLVVAAAVSGHSIAPASAVAALRQFGLKGREDLPSRVLSAGQRRKVNLSRLLLPEVPALWVLDEPYTALDQRAVAQLSGIMAGHLARGGMIVFTTHQDVDLPGAAVRRLVLENGKATSC